MARNAAKGKSGVVRPIKTERDYRGAAGVVKKLGGEAKSEPESEKRLRALIREMDKFDEPPDEDADDLAGDKDYGGPLRRWSDDAADSD